MYTPLSPTEMRRVVLEGFQQHFSRKISGEDVEERVRIEEGQAVAYSYRTENLFAMWMVPIGLVQFYDDRGNMLHTVDLMAPVSDVRRAA